MRHPMKNCVWLLVFLLLVPTFVNDQARSYAAAIQQQPPRQPAPGKKFVTTPFGPIEVDISDPREAIAVGPPLQPATPPGPAAAQPAPATAQAQPDQDVPVLFNFDNFNINQAIQTIARILGINYVVDPQVRGTVNIGMSGNVRRSELFGVFEAILKMNGATMIKAGNFYQIVPANTAVRMPIEVQRALPAVAPDDQIVLQVLPMKFVTADEMARLLTPYLSEAGNIVSQGSVLLVTDRRSNLRKLLEIVDEFDSRAFQGERVRILPVKNNRVKDVVDDLKTVFSGYALSNNTAIRFLTIERMNSVLVVTPNPDVFPEVERWLDRLDQALPTAGLRNYVYKAKNAKAVDIQKVLTELYREQFQATQPGQQQQSPLVSPAAPVGAPTVVPAPESTGVAVASARLSGQLRIVADTINNALVIQATPQDYEAILRTIEELDVLPRQVLIDTQIYEVSLDHSLSLGLSAILQSQGTLKQPAPTTASFTTSGLAASTFAFIGRSQELVAFLNASENRGRVRTLSAPSILVSNNSTAQVNIGAEVPIPTSTAASGAQQNGSTLFAQTIAFRDTGVILSVTPQINDGGNVTLTIAQEVSQASANTTSSINAPVIGKSSVKSVIVIQNGETIPLTGFIRDSDTLSRNRVPLLGSIPGAGVLFGNTTKQNTRSELIVLITPHVITTIDERAAAAEELRNKLKETKRVIN